MAVAKRPLTPFEEDLFDDRVENPSEEFKDNATQTTARVDKNPIFLSVVECLMACKLKSVDGWQYLRLNSLIDDIAR